MRHCCTLQPMDQCCGRRSSSCSRQWQLATAMTAPGAGRSFSWRRFCPTCPHLRRAQSPALDRRCGPFHLPFMLVEWRTHPRAHPTCQRAAALTQTSARPLSLAAHRAAALARTCLALSGLQPRLPLLATRRSAAPLIPACLRRLCSCCLTFRITLGFGALCSLRAVWSHCSSCCHIRAALCVYPLPAYWPTWWSTL